MNVNPKTSLIVAYRPDDGPRQRAWEWLERKWRAMWPALEICVSNDDGEDPFCKSMALNRAVDQSHGDVLIIADADVYVNVQMLARYSIKLFQREYQFLSPWNRWLGMSEESTERIIKSGPGSTLQITSDMRRTMTPERHDTAPGSLIMVPREAYDMVGGYDERFRGWGGDDSSFFWAVDTLWGRHHRTEGELVHLWHPRGMAPYRRQWVWEGQSQWTHKPLEMKYQAAWRNPHLMYRMVEEPGRRSHS